MTSWPFLPVEHHHCLAGSYSWWVKPVIEATNFEEDQLRIILALKGFCVRSPLRQEAQSIVAKDRARLVVIFFLRKGLLSQALGESLKWFYNGDIFIRSLRLFALLLCLPIDGVASIRVIITSWRCLLDHSDYHVWLHFLQPNFEKKHLNYCTFCFCQLWYSVNRVSMTPGLASQESNDVCQISC